MAFMLSVLTLSFTPLQAAENEDMLWEQNMTSVDNYRGLSEGIAKELDDAIISKDVDLVSDILSEIILTEEEATAKRVSDYVFALMPEVQNAFKTASSVSYFDFDEHNIEPNDKRQIAEVASSIAKDWDGRLVTVSGHADRFGSDEYNDELSMKRAEAVKNILVENGVSNVEVKAYGKRSPVSICDPEMDTASLIGCLRSDRKVSVSTLPQPRTKIGRGRDHIVSSAAYGDDAGSKKDQTQVNALSVSGN